MSRVIPTLDLDDIEMKLDLDFTNGWVTILGAIEMG